MVTQSGERNGQADARCGHLALVTIVGREKGASMADVYFVALIVGIFVLLALILRGLEKLQ
jgi:hypothetical protein